MVFNTSILSYKLFVAIQLHRVQPIDPTSVQKGRRIERAPKDLVSVSDSRSIENSLFPEIWINRLLNALDIEEKGSKKFIGRTWFLNVALLEHLQFAGKSLKVRARLLQQAIDEGKVETYTVPNPFSPHPTTAIRLKSSR